MSRPESGDEGRALRVEDRRHWARGASDDDAPETVDPGTEAETAEASPPSDVAPSELDALRVRAEAAEQKLGEFQSEYQRWRAEQEQVRLRLERDVERKVALRFGDLVGEVLGVVDDLDLALEHVHGVEEAEPLAKGVAIARDRFLQTIARLGVDRLDLDGSEFDPKLAEAVAVVAAESADAHGKVLR